MRLLSFTLFALVLVGCVYFDALSSEPLPVDEEITLTGHVVDTIDDCVVDGICALIIEAEAGRYIVVWNQGWIPCEGKMARDIPANTTLEVFGVVTDENTVSICPSPDYYIRVAK
jgi:hypothetical protein